MEAWSAEASSAQQSSSNGCFFYSHRDQATPPLPSILQIQQQINAGSKGNSARQARWWWCWANPSNRKKMMLVLWSWNKRMVGAMEVLIAGNYRGGWIYAQLRPRRGRWYDRGDDAGQSKEGGKWRAQLMVVMVTVKRPDDDGAQLGRWRRDRAQGRRRKEVFSKERRKWYL